MTCPFCNQKKDHIFVESKHSLGIVNLKPIIPGHLLFISKRHIKRFNDLNKEEINDIFNLIHSVNKQLMNIYNADSLSINIQDGQAAGQTVNHFHIHVVPRKKNDIDSKEFYNKLQKDSHERKPRSNEEMKKEADKIKLSI